MADEVNLDDLCERSGYRKNLDRLEAALATLPSLSLRGPWLAGGALRRLLLGTDPLASDLDFFFRDEEQATAFESTLKNCGFVSRLKTKHATTWTRPTEDGQLVVQAVKIGFYENLNDCLDTFDFTICQLGYDGESLALGKHTLWDLGRKRLAVHKVTFATATVRRLIKYTKQGFIACSGCIASILNAVAEDPELVKAEVEYVD